MSLNFEQIENLYQKLRKDINQLFEANNLEIRPNYWKKNTMHGTQSFLDINIDVTKESNLCYRKLTI